MLGFRVLHYSMLVFLMHLSTEVTFKGCIFSSRLPVTRVRLALLPGKRISASDVSSFPYLMLGVNRDYARMAVR
jgi:hypothetical protein